MKGGALGLGFWRWGLGNGGRWEYKGVCRRVLGGGVVEFEYVGTACFCVMFYIASWACSCSLFLSRVCLWDLGPVSQSN